jgi:multiple sugar transport system ATP-binding protein
VGQAWPTVVQAQGSEGQQVQYGVRPTDIHVATSGAGIPAKVIVVEPTGAETELLVRVGDANLVVVMHGRTPARPDDTVYLTVADDKTHVFDAAGGQRLDTLPSTLQ